MISDSAQDPQDSRLGRVSIRALIALVPMLALCAMAIVVLVRTPVADMDKSAVLQLIVGVIKDVVLMSAAWYLGQKGAAPSK